MLRFGLLLLAVLASGCTASSHTILVTRVGTYEIEDKTVVQNPSSPTLVSLKTEVEGKRTKVVPRDETTQIYGKVGYSFGVEYSVPKQLQSDLQVVVTVPSPGVRDLRTGKFLLASDFTPPCVEARCTAIYNFEHESELVPGLWTIELLSRKQIVHVHRFELKQ